jgi:hypothetical protein
MIVATASTRAATESPSYGEILSVALRGEEESARLERWRDRGADDDTRLFCLATSRLEGIVDANARAHHHLVVASMPKSGSTYLQKVLVHVTGFRPYWLNTAGNDNERNLELTAIPMFLAQDTVTQEHMRATRANVQWLKRMGVRPIMLVRNIFDVIVSSRDHSAGGDICGPNAHTPAAYNTWSPEDQAWFIIRMGLPWLLTFVSSWLDAQRELPVLWVSYEEIVQRTASTVARILDHAGVERKPADIQRLAAEVDLGNVRFNRGLSGRGESELTGAQRQAVRDLAAVYRGAYDFSLIGL